MTIDTTKSIDQLRAELCIEFFRLQVGKKEGSWICTACARTEKDHQHDGRCTSYATSLSFRAAETTQMSDTEKALNLLDQLRAIGGATCSNPFPIQDGDETVAPTHDRLEDRTAYGVSYQEWCECPGSRQPLVKPTRNAEEKCP